MIELKNISKFFGKHPKIVKALDEISLTILPGEIIFICGHNGSGKSTLLKVISGIEEPENGSQMHYLDKETIDWKKFGKDNCVFIPQSIDDVIAKQVTVNEFISLFPNSNVNNLTEALGTTWIEDKQNSLLGELSGGQRQLLFGLIALSKPQSIFLLDEVFSDLDKKNSFHYWEAIKRKNKEGDICILIVSHDLELALKKATRLIVLNKGKVIINKSPSEITIEELAKKATIIN